MAEKSKKVPQPQPPVEYYDPILIAFVRGYTGEVVSDLNTALAYATLHGLRIDKFKRRKVLPRVQRVIDLMRPHNPPTVLDVGCGRGTAMWPMMEAFPTTFFVGVDEYEGRSKDLCAIRDNGVSQILGGLHLSATSLTGVETKSHPFTVCLEVLEHIRDDEAAVRELLRVTRERVFISVPSVPDWNPDHLRLYTAGALKNLWLRAGAAKVVVHDDVPKHFVAEITPKK